MVRTFRVISVVVSIDVLDTELKNNEKCQAIPFFTKEWGDVSL